MLPPYDPTTKEFLAFCDYYIVKAPTGKISCAFFLRRENPFKGNSNIYFF
jgi:hypothetical protein